ANGDCRFISAGGTEEFTDIFVGIAIETPDLLLADRPRGKGKKIDGVLIHHPEGRALADLEKVMSLQVDLLAGVGVPVNQSETVLRPRMDKIWRAIHADNLFRVERAAELLNVPAVCCHTITDNMVWAFMEKHICKNEYDDMGEILNAISEIPEYTTYAKKGNPPIIVNGSRNSRVGKLVATEFTGGTNGPEEFFEAKARAGVGTVLSMHVTEKSLEEAKKHRINIIQCSHMASDALGVNLMLDEMKKKDSKMTFIEASGFIRVERKKW
ncbi:MAG: hypothetical protein KBA40_04295, partial [Candidatus Peribacteraceae bacterium]|nr:hypothetical protein [Candidatus Peribacteraceae bacterium]